MTVPTPQEIARGCLLRILAQPGRYKQETWQTVAAGELNLPDDDDPDRFDGIEVSCATTGCVAGTAAMLAGDVGLLQEENLRTLRRLQLRNPKAALSIGTVRTQSGEHVSIQARGRELLGLSHSDASWLFAGHRTLAEVVYALKELSDGQPISKRGISNMSPEEWKALSNYRVTPVVKRKVVTPEAQARQRVAAPHRDS